MLKQLFMVGALTLGLSAAASVSAPSFGLKGNSTMGYSTGRTVRPQIKSAKSAMRAPKGSVNTADSSLPQSDQYGFLYLPDGRIWTYTADITTSGNYYQKASFTIYDENNREQGTVSKSFDSLPEGATGVNSVQLNPYVTKKFFNIDSNYEVIVFAHAVTPDYTGIVYNDVFALTTDSVSTTPLMTIPGNQIEVLNFAENSWTENVYMIFAEEDYDDPSSETMMVNYSVYGKANYSSLQAPVLLHTFTLDYTYLAQSGEEACTMFMLNHNGKPVYGTAQCEQSFFDLNLSVFEDPQVNPDNYYIITLYDADFNQTSQTRIPMEQVDGYLYTFYALGGLNYEDDVTYGQYTSDDQPAFIITRQNYDSSSDGYYCSYYVYDVDGNIIDTIIEDVEASVDMTDVAGEETQIAFFTPSGSDNYLATMIDFPSLKVASRFKMMRDDLTLTTSIDRLPCRGGYEYVTSMQYGVEDEEGNTYHRIGYLDREGNITKLDSVNLGQNVQYALPYIDASVLSPYLYDTDSQREYTFLVKRTISASSSAAEEVLYIVRADGTRLLTFEPADSLGGELTNISLINADTKPTLLVAYLNDATSDYKYTPHMVYLPLESFTHGGNGSAADPYVISSAGDMMLINRAPSKNYIIDADIDFSTENWEGVTEDFTGSIDGQNHIISGLNFENAAIFSNINQGGKVQNLVLDSPKLTVSGLGYRGFVAGEISGTAARKSAITGVSVYNPTVSASSDFSGKFGTIAGNAASYSQLTDCNVEYADIDLGSAGQGGGIVGSMRTSSVASANHFSGIIRGGSYLGGIVGTTVTGDETISNNHVEASLCGNNTIGGIIGESSRSLVKNNFFAGDLTSTSTTESNLGGVAGTLCTLYSGKDSAKPVEGNLVKITSLTTAQVCTGDTIATAHRIVGRSSADEPAKVNYENTKFDWDNWDGDLNAEGLPLTYFSAESNIANNYSVGSFAAVAASIGGDDHTSTEGQTISSITAELLDSIGFAWGTTTAAPWMAGTADSPALYFENNVYGLSADVALIYMHPDETAQIVYTLLGNATADDLKVESSNAAVAAVKEIIPADDVNHIVMPNTIFATIECMGEGNADITATLGSHTATVSIVAQTAGIRDVTVDSTDATSTTDAWYDLRGRRVSAPQAHGVYIHVVGSRATKVLN